MSYLEARSLPSLNSHRAGGPRRLLHRLSGSVSPLIREPALGGRDLRPSQTRPPDLAGWSELSRTRRSCQPNPSVARSDWTAQRPVSFLPPRLGAHPRARQGESPAWAPSPSPPSAPASPPASPRPWSAPPARGPQPARGQGPRSAGGAWLAVEEGSADAVASGRPGHNSKNTPGPWGRLLRQRAEDGGKSKEAGKVARLLSLPSEPKRWTCGLWGRRQPGTECRREGVVYAPKGAGERGEETGVRVGDIL